ncbi:hypothetical protein BMS3Bbin02_01200 [bacterium BMS3Bbin02]|nr:hypothetical protein BMS3Bbin02_01200 [bacterium BMS3Bbin02]
MEALLDASTSKPEPPVFVAVFTIVFPTVPASTVAVIVRVSNPPLARVPTFQTPVPDV